LGPAKSRRVGTDSKPRNLIRSGPRGKGKNRTVFLGILHLAENRGRSRAGRRLEGNYITQGKDIKKFLTYETGRKNRKNCRKKGRSLIQCKKKRTKVAASLRKQQQPGVPSVIGRSGSEEAEDRTPHGGEVCRGKNTREKNHGETRGKTSPARDRSASEERKEE